jgi:uncharacterized protein YdhG (YjbR/CyaY superfamily)
VKKPASVDEYIAGFPPDIRQYLEEIRQTIQIAAPLAQETISYAMPCYRLNGYLVYFAAFSYHIGFYPMPSSIKEFREELSVYKSAKGSVQLPVGQPLPKDLITRIVKFRLAENMNRKTTGKKS